MSCGPGEASGWPWKQNAGRSVRARPCSVPSNSLTCVGRRLAGSDASSTAKPWFWLVMLTRPLSRSFTGWLAPWWPNFILKVFAPEASAMIWWPRQMPKVGMPVSISLARGGDRVVAGLGVAGAVAQEDAVGPQRQHLGGRRLRRHHGDAATAAGQHAQDVALDAEVVGHDVEAWLGQRAVAAGPAPIRSRSTRRARVADTTLARSRPAMRGCAPGPRAIASSTSRRRDRRAGGRLTMQPFCAPVLRSTRVRRRVSMSAMATVPSRSQVLGQRASWRGSWTRAAAGP